MKVAKKKKQFGITLDPDVQEAAAKHAKKYNRSLSEVINALLTDWNTTESRKKPIHENQKDLF